MLERKRNALKARGKSPRKADDSETVLVIAAVIQHCVGPYTLPMEANPARRGFSFLRWCLGLFCLDA